MPSFRRRLLIHAAPQVPAATYRAVLEDDFHHFRVELVLHGGKITAAQGTAIRFPYSMCPSAAAQLEQLVGHEAMSCAHSVMRMVDPGQQCTHLLELAGLAAAVAALGLKQRHYEIDVPLRVDGRTQARLSRDGLPLLCWDIDDLQITGPAPYTDLALGQGMARWALANLSEDEAEAALVLRRCAVISRGKGLPLDEQVHARPTGACFAQQVERAPLASRQIGSTWDFSTTPDRLCVDDQDWLAFRDGAA